MKIAISQSAPSTIETALLVILVADNGDKTPLPAAAGLRSGPPGSGRAAHRRRRPHRQVRRTGLGLSRPPESPPSASSSSAPASATSSRSHRASQPRRSRRPRRQVQEHQVLRPRSARACSKLPAAAQAAVEGIVAGDFDVDTYRSDRKDQQLTDVTLAIPAKADAGAVYPGHRRGRHPGRVAELHPHPRPGTQQPDDSHHPRRARPRHVRGSRPGLRGVRSRQAQGTKDGSLPERLPRLGGRAAPGRHALRARRRARLARPRTGRQGHHL